MLCRNTRRGFTQIKRVGQALPDNAPAKGHLASFINEKTDLIVRFTTDLPIRSGFTLIELLVVVLIIGVLAAVAVPQYQLAVDKARLSKLLSMVNAVKKAENAYYLENGTYTKNWNDLTLSFPGTVDGASLTSDEGWELRLDIAKKNSGNANGVIATDSLLQDIKIYNFYRNDNVWNEHLACYALMSNVRANRLCKSATGASEPDEDSGSGVKYNVYFFN